MKLVLVTLALAAAPAAAFAPHVPESDEPTVSPTSYPTVKPTIKEVECVDAGCAEHPQCDKTNYDSGVVPNEGEDEVFLSGHYLRIGVNAYARRRARARLICPPDSSGGPAASSRLLSPEAGGVALQAASGRGAASCAAGAHFW